MGGEPGVKFHPIFVELFVHPTERTGDFEAKAHLAQLAKTTWGCMGGGFNLLGCSPSGPKYLPATGKSNAAEDSESIRC